MYVPLRNHGWHSLMTGVDPLSRDNPDPKPDGTGTYLNRAAFARPTGR